eukprot:scaffold47789_cov32-Cyclotella_meneghiniana.AAC.1
MDISLGMVGQRVVESSNNEDTGVFGRQRDAPNDDMGDVKGVDACAICLVNMWVTGEIGVGKGCCGGISIGWVCSGKGGVQLTERKIR